MEYHEPQSPDISILMTVLTFLAIYVHLFSHSAAHTTDCFDMKYKRRETETKSFSKITVTILCNSRVGNHVTSF